jgi:small-conductance mechanosensitive channel
LSEPRPSGGTRVTTTRAAMNGLIYLIGLIVVIMAILSFFGLR